MTHLDDAGGGPAAHPSFERLNDLVDGILTPPERDAVAHHLAACAPCRDRAGALRRLVVAAGAAPREVAPPPEVWTAVRGRLRDRGIAMRARRAWWGRAGAAAAAAAVVFAVSVARRAPRRGAGPAGAPVASVPPRPAPRTAVLDRAAREVAAALDSRAAALPPAARASLDRSLGVVDTAIAEARAALAADPSNGAVAEALGAAQERRVELLLQAARILAD